MRVAFVGLQILQIPFSWHAFNFQRLQNKWDGAFVSNKFLQFFAITKI